MSSTRTKERETSRWKRSTMSEQVSLNSLLLSKRFITVPAAWKGMHLSCWLQRPRAVKSGCCCQEMGRSVPAAWEGTCTWGAGCIGRGEWSGVAAVKGLAAASLQLHQGRDGECAAGPPPAATSRPSRDPHCLCPQMSDNAGLWSLQDAKAGAAYLPSNSAWRRHHIVAALAMHLTTCPPRLELILTDSCAHL